MTSLFVAAVWIVAVAMVGAYNLGNIAYDLRIMRKIAEAREEREERAAEHIRPPGGAA